MRTDLRPLARLALAATALFAAGAVQAQPLPPAGPPVPVADGAEEAEAPPPRARRVRSRIRPYLEVSQVVSAELGEGDVLTYTSLAAGVDGRVETRRVRAQIGYRYERRIEWSGDVPDRDVHSGIAQLNATIVPGLLDFDAGALATRTGGYGRALGLTGRDSSVEVYSLYAGPTVSARAGPLAINGAYRFGYTVIDDDTAAGLLRDEIGDSTVHSLTGSIGMGTGGRLPFGWTLGAGYGRASSGGRFDHRFEGMYVRGDVVVPVTPTLALTAGVGFENFEASQHDIARDADQIPIVDGQGRPVADPTLPRVLTYDVDGIIYDAGVIWRPSARTELQARAGRRYGGTTVVGSLQHRIDSEWGLGVTVYDTVETFSHALINNISALPANAEIGFNPLTGGLGGGCVFGADPGSGACFDRTLQSIGGNTFRSRGATLMVSGGRGPWSLGLGAGYGHRRYFRPDDVVFDALVGRSDRSVSLYASAGRRLSRTSQVSLDTYATWFDSDLAAFENVFSTGATASYRRSFLLERLQLLAALGLYHADDGLEASTVGSGLIGLRYGF